jgi:hypothetical protein
MDIAMYTGRLKQLADALQSASQSEKQVKSSICFGASPPSIVT